MTDVQTLALWSPVALVVFVSAIVLLEELSNQRAMKRESAAASKMQSRTKILSGQMTIETGRYVFEKTLDKRGTRRVG